MRTLATPPPGQALSYKKSAEILMALLRVALPVCPLPLPPLNRSLIKAPCKSIVTESSGLPRRSRRTTGQGKNVNPIRARGYVKAY